ncbi:hypothetical protein DFQ27_006432 [Actinomortierella ambigua]|uniref:DUF7719 domain-containing protein n=1 Tax=Actinomortierella ambigua TaxID=1343610 RepID=A0A9P6PVS3_9FUNG|nr:hypothetical protein DFQ27_006432 [Actinomortierella ambigua]
MAEAQRRKKTSNKTAEQDVGVSSSNALHKAGKVTSSTTNTKNVPEEDSEFSEVDGTESESESDVDGIPDQEKWRLITESGIMGRLQERENQHKHGDDNDDDSSEELDDSNRDYLFEGIFFSIPTTCLFVVMDILVHRQYGETYSGANIFRKIVKIFPAILLMVYFSNKTKRYRAVQALMFTVSVACGCYFLRTMYRSPALGIMQRAPGIVTILVYCMVQMDLLPAALSIILCGLYFQYGDVKY